MNNHFMPVKIEDFSRRECTCLAEIANIFIFLVKKCLSPTFAPEMMEERERRTFPFTLPLRDIHHPKGIERSKCHRNHIRKP